MDPALHGAQTLSTGTTALTEPGLPGARTVSTGTTSLTEPGLPGARTVSTRTTALTEPGLPGARILSTGTTALTEPALPGARILSTGTPPCCGPGPSMLWITIRQTFERVLGPGRMHHHPNSGGVDKGQGLPSLSAQLPPLGQPMLLGQRKGRGSLGKAGTGAARATNSPQPRNAPPAGSDPVEDSSSSPETHNPELSSSLRSLNLGRVRAASTNRGSDARPHSGHALPPTLSPRTASLGPSRRIGRELDSPWTGHVQRLRPAAQLWPQLTASGKAAGESSPQHSRHLQPPSRRSCGRPERKSCPFRALRKGQTCGHSD
ncbi:unnamed protein product [Rangifer tarandus platyrhynchus]|uniref:Uncharacterized protein n=2 Tax=Rangifer tarandus platyrhynchus TaxID=3082113 RepID=A0ACB0F4P9_RANTA|nr:unnamed protein product [Rangifer tarandus platyrhynchus]CAI9707091.1 unnamed protein product [Rangifer tarandus platyrhynchus]